jgi:hypothetical protein
MGSNCIDAEAMIKTWSIGGDYNMIKVCTFNPNKRKGRSYSQFGYGISRR